MVTVVIAAFMVVTSPQAGLFLSKPNSGPVQTGLTGEWGCAPELEAWDKKHPPVCWVGEQGVCLLVSSWLLELAGLSWRACSRGKVGWCLVGLPGCWGAGLP